MTREARPVLKFIPAWREDETLYSWAASYHFLYGNGSSRDTGSRLFGIGHACREHDAPSGIKHLVAITDGMMGSASELLRWRCALGMFVPFLPPGRFEDVIEQALRQGSGNWTALLGMPRSRLCPSSQLRFCPSCVRQDLTVWELPRWRLTQQLPGTWICPDHQSLLHVSGGMSSVWTLPSPDDCQHLSYEPTGAQVAALVRLARLTDFAYRMPYVDVGVVRQSVLSGLRDLGVSTWSRVLSKKRLTSWFMSLPISQWLGEQQNPVAALSSGDWMHDLIKHRRGDHPLKWLILWSSVFDDSLDSSRYQRFGSPRTDHGREHPGQGSLWAPSDTALPLDLIHQMSGPTKLDEIASKLGLAQQTLRLRLAAQGGRATDLRTALKAPQRRDFAIKAIQDFIELNPDCSRSDVHRRCKAAVEWMRRNAPEAYAIATEKLRYRSSPQLQLPFDLN